MIFLKKALQKYTKVPITATVNLEDGAFMEGTHTFLNVKKGLKL